MTNKTNAEKFRAFCIKKIKHDPGEIRVTPEGGYIRFSTNGESHDKSGSYQFRGDWGTVKDFRAKTQKVHVWKTDRVLSDDEREVMEDELSNAAGSLGVTDEHRAASQKMREWYATLKFDLPNGSQNHAYLEKKNIVSPGLFIDKGALIIPLYNKDRQHVNVQKIFQAPVGEDGRQKFYYTKAEASNLHYIFGEISDRFIIAEGFATGATLHETTGWPVAITVNADAMPTVSMYLREFYPDAQIIIAADDDISSKNKGESKATEAAFAINAQISLPPFDRSVVESTRDFSDWNDYARVYGKGNVADKFFECAVDPQRETLEAIRGEAYKGTIPDAVAEINRTYFVSKDKGKFVIMEERPDIGDGPELWQHSLQDFTLTFCDRKIEVNGKSIELGQYWIKHPARRKYFGGVTFNPRPNLPSDIYNLYTGLGVAPSTKGSWSYLREHVKKIVCRDNELHFEYLLNWMARLLQYPWLMGETIVVMKGIEGSGKGILANALLRIVGRHGMPIQDEELLTGRFNGHLCDMIYLFVDEAFFAGGKKHIGKMKVYASESVLSYEPKGRPAYMGPNYLHIMMASNEDWVVPASTNDRRYFVLDVKPDFANNQDYFKEIRDQLDEGGYEAMAHELLNRDISNFNPRVIPLTDALFAQKELSLPVFEKWLFDVLSRGYVCESDFGTEELYTWHEMLEASLVYNSYKDYAKSQGVRNPLTHNIFGKHLKPLGIPETQKKTNVIMAERRQPEGHGAAVRSTTQVRARILGPLDELRKTFAKDVLKKEDYVWPEEPPKPPVQPEIPGLKEPDHIREALDNQEE